MINFAKLVGYRKGIRPVQPESLPTFIDTEFTRVAVVTSDLIAHIQNLEERLAALEP